MNTKEINLKLKKIKQFKGTYCRNNIRDIKTRPFIIICNTDPCSKPGQHWIAIFVKKDGTGEYFDSYGLPPLHIEFIDFLNKKCPKGWSYNKMQLQSTSSKTCGMYCCLYVRMKANKLSMDKMFTSNTFINDFLMKKRYSQYKRSL